MNPVVREMRPAAVDVVVDYLHGATAEHLELLGVDPAPPPGPERWRRTMQDQLATPVPQRLALLVLWELDGAPVGFSSADKIVYGEQASLHLHVRKRRTAHGAAGGSCEATASRRRRSRTRSSACVRRSPSRRRLSIAR